MEDYKGIYYNDTKEQKFYEGGAHFKYTTLYKILLSLGGVTMDEEYEHSSINSYRMEKIKSNKDIDSLLRKVEGKKSKYKTRNLAHFRYVNNPNTQIKLNPHNSNLSKKVFLSKKDFYLRNDNNNNDHSYFFDKRNKNKYNDKTNSSLSINNLSKDNINNLLMHILLNKRKEKIKKYNILNYSKCIHNRNRSEIFENDNHSTRLNKNRTNNRNNLFNNLRKFDTINKSQINNNKISVNKSSLNNENKDDDKRTLDINVNNGSNSIEKKDILLKKKIKYPVVYGKSKIFKIKDTIKINNHSSFIKNNIKKSRNNINNNNVKNIKTSENNKNNNGNCNNSYKRKYIKKYLFTNENNKKKDTDINNNSNTNNQTNKTSNTNYNSINYNKTINNNDNNNICSNGDNIFKNMNIKNKEKVLKTNENNFISQKYIKKKINQLCVFNNNNGRNKNGNKNIGKGLFKSSKINKKIII